MGANAPATAKEGKQPIRKDATAIMRMETERDHLRPYLSPQHPQSTAPIGRSRKDRANMANV
ncbi:hypothetical protein TPCU426_06160 [Cutibacterium acnes]|jgi:hypothetical protein|uniref:Uncharacterized protein n=1 Tax=Cutibacterium acnes subsp. acnes TaxID=1734925 RepID=A0ABM7GWA3_CUTAC|nr:hypothetical protein TPCU389_06310 [Cutibacterium acnes]BBK84007.1 hypothetical protein CacPP4_06220 [Cutibacterium acnes subsp. acnes]BCB10487.1 hypothetical protein CASZ1_06160 [Cutibacterium acnes]BCB12713.1 hypothetical protein CASZ2_06170 [Cutibacterium acnes]BDQ41819.1 hypothetical protein TPCU426_06160 [Cutibacterium acnes]